MFAKISLLGSTDLLKQININTGQHIKTAKTRESVVWLIWAEVVLLATM